jgi:hypothetical protein
MYFIPRRWFMTLSRDIGLARGYAHSPYAADLPDLRADFVGGTIPPGWETLMKVINSVSELDPAMVLGVLNGQEPLPDTDLASAGIVAAAREMAMRTDKVTASMHAI